MRGANASSIGVTFANYEDEILNDNFRGGGGSGDGGSSGGVFPISYESEPGGGMLFVVVEEIVFNGNTLQINARGNNGGTLGAGISDQRNPGGGGGGCVCVVTRTGTFPTIDVRGGEGGGGFNPFGTAGQPGGLGTEYTGRALPWG